jgi:hypothetical protein
MPAGKEGPPSFPEDVIKGPRLASSLSSRGPSFADDLQPGFATMMPTFLFSRAAAARLAIAVVLLLLTTTSSIEASVDQPSTHVAAGAPQVAAQTALGPPLVAALFGDRQRIVQVAMIVMGVAIMILVCGNRF